MTYTVYILQSQFDGSFYIGYTSNLLAGVNWKKLKPSA